MWRHWCFGGAGEGIVAKVPVLMVMIEEALVVLGIDGGSGGGVGGGAGMIGGAAEEALAEC